LHQSPQKIRRIKRARILNDEERAGRMVLQKNFAADRFVFLPMVLQRIGSMVLQNMLLQET
jgi:hypothetical protein